MRVVGASLDLEALVGAPVVDDDRERVVVLRPEEGDLEAVADPVGQLPIALLLQRLHGLRVPCQMWAA
jgi:hypothetical protein